MRTSEWRLLQAVLLLFLCFGMVWQGGVQEGRRQAKEEGRPDVSEACRERESGTGEYSYLSYHEARIARYKGEVYESGEELRAAAIAFRQEVPPMKIWQWLETLFNAEGFMPRRLCGVWTPGLAMLHQASDFLIFLSYMLIPLFLAMAYRAYRQDRLDTTKIQKVLPLFAVEFTAFVFFCGVSHFHQVLVFWYPVYRWFGLWSCATAAISLATVGTLALTIGQSILPHAPMNVSEAQNGTDSNGGGIAPPSSPASDHKPDTV